ncbi:hypothetical protein WJX84_007064 [Apatococcus fuscideae]|uniref:Tyrosine specific protein phosphatases domain-containing protein n=1 Tax=Apatococcus fuscideae TaxID=2026836 RepID=A0AAW1SQP4_9CHLO
MRPFRHHHTVAKRSVVSANFRQVAPRPVPLTRILDDLKGIKNTRDLAEACANIQPGRIIRSGSPAQAAPADVNILRSSASVSHLVDLRSDYERREDGDTNIMRSASSLRTVSAGQMTPVASFAAKKPEQPGLSALSVNHISLLERRRYYLALLRRLPVNVSGPAIFWQLFNPSYGKSLIIQEINKGGLPQLYEVMLETAKPEIKCAMEVVTAAAEAGEVVMFFCKLGKDRTGLIALFILSCCGSTDDEIISDYHRSDGVEEIALGGAEKEVQGLDVALFSAAPCEAMAATLQNLRSRYNGPLEYLEAIGFGRGPQLRLKYALARSSAQEQNEQSL